MMSAKIATACRILKGYDVIIHVDGVTNKCLSRDSNYIVDAFT